MAEYEVIAEFVDTRIGKRVLPGETTEANEEEAERMRAAKVIGKNMTAEAEKKAEEAARLEVERKKAEEEKKNASKKEPAKKESDGEDQ